MLRLSPGRKKTIQHVGGPHFLPIHIKFSEYILIGSGDMLPKLNSKHASGGKILLSLSTRFADCKTFVPQVVRTPVDSHLRTFVSPEIYPFLPNCYKAKIAS